MKIKKQKRSMDTKQIHKLNKITQFKIKNEKQIKRIKIKRVKIKILKIKRKNKSRKNQ